MRLPARIFGQLLLAAALVAPAAAQRLEPPATGGIAALDQILRRLGQDRRVLVIGAHPDDEDTELLTVLTRGDGASAAYLSLTRGEGGQNLIGSELGDALGLLRSEELMAARELDGARQFFSRAYDFGYSKTLEDTWAHWPRDSVLKDVVRVVRRFRPHVIVSIFSGTARDGHGQHQAAGWAAREAFTVAADPQRFPELAAEEGLSAWRPLKLYRSTRFDPAATTLAIEGGVLDPAEGRSFHQIAMRSRSLHQSQDMGQLQSIGPSLVRLALLEDRTGSGAGGFFAGLDAPEAGLPERFARLADSARAVLGPASLDDVRHLLRDARAALVAGSDDAEVQPGASTAAGEQLVLLDRAMAIAGEVVVDAVALDDRLAAGEPVTVILSAWNASPAEVTVTPALEPSWSDAPLPSPGPRTIAPGDTATWTVDVPVPADAPPTTPYFVRPAGAGLYEVAAGTPVRARGLPFGAAPLVADFAVQHPQSWTYLVSREVAYRFNDQATGEVRRPLTVVPRVEVSVEPPAEFWAIGDTAARTVRVTVTNRARAPFRGTVALEAPAGWERPEPRPVSLAEEDTREVVEFRVRPPTALRAGIWELHAVAERGAGGESFRTSLDAVEYPHVRTRTYEVPATLTVTGAPLALPSLRRIAYVRGAADRVPEALSAVGFPVEIIDGAALARGDLAQYDAIVIGPRAYEVDSGLVRNSRRLLDYAEAGGLVIVQYQQHAFFGGGFAPYPLELAPRHDRVADETAQVTVLEPDHRTMRTPNPIGDADWEGWVQERGLYFARAWDSRYTPLLELHDPDEPPLGGALLVAPVGEGTWVYTGISFFRQLPAGVPGAYRLFANLLGLAGERPGRPTS